MRRRQFVAAAGSCTGYLVATLAAGTPLVRRAFAAQPVGKTRTTEPWGRIEELGEGIWALVSTPLVDHPRANLSVSNGGIVAGRNGVAIIEGLVSEEGARWLASAARELTGRDPDHVVLTHYHGDHSSGLSAYTADRDGPVLHASSLTLDTLEISGRSRGRESATAGFVGERIQRTDGPGSRWIDLGDRRLEIRAASGHTESDLYVVLEDPRITWCGDLVWNGLFPNYVNAIPTLLSASVRSLAKERMEAWVPGHGNVADRAALDRYVVLIDEVEERARRAFEAGDPPSAAAAGYRPSEALGEWVLFSPRYYEVAIASWHNELSQRG